jgi:hypothetical protein
MYSSRVEGGFKLQAVQRLFRHSTLPWRVGCITWRFDLLIGTVILAALRHVGQPP